MAMTRRVEREPSISAKLIGRHIAGTGTAGGGWKKGRESRNLHDLPSSTHLLSWMISGCHVDLP